MGQHAHSLAWLQHQLTAWLAIHLRLLSQPDHLQMALDMIAIPIMASLPAAIHPSVSSVFQNFTNLLRDLTSSAW